MKHLLSALGECQLHTGRARDARHTFENATKADASKLIKSIQRAGQTLRMGERIGTLGSTP